MGLSFCLSLPHTRAFVLLLGLPLLLPLLFAITSLVERDGGAAADTNCWVLRASENVSTAATHLRMGDLLILYTVGAASSVNLQRQVRANRDRIFFFICLPP